MAWNSGQNCNGANIHPENQYLMQHGQQAVSTLSNQVIGMPPNSSGHGSMNMDRFYASQSQERYLESLLKAKSNEDMDRLQQSILSLPSYPQSNQVAQTQATVVSTNVPYRPLPSGGGTYSSQDYSSQNIQMKRINYIPKHYVNIATQSQKPLQSLQSQQNVHGKPYDTTAAASRSGQIQSQTFPQTGSFGPSQTQGTHQAQSFPNLPSYSASRHSIKGSYPRPVLSKVPLTSKTQYDLQNGAKHLKLTSYTPSSFVTGSTSNNDCTQSLQTPLVSNSQTGPADGSVFIERSSDCHPKSTSTASMPSQSLPIQTRSAPQAQSVQSSQPFPSQAQNYVPLAVQLSTSSICEPNRASQLVQYMRSLPHNSKEREDFSVLLQLYNKVKQNILRMAIEGEQKMQNGQIPTNSVPGGVSINSDSELNTHPTLQTLTSNMQTMNATSGTPNKHNVQQSACFQIRATGNQASTSSSKKLESRSQNYAPLGWNVNDQAAFSASGQQACVNTPSYSNRSLGSNNYIVNQVMSVRSAAFPNLNAEAIPQNVNQEFIPNVNTQTESMSQTGALQHNESLPSPQLPRATTNYQNNGHLVPNMGQVATVSIDHSGFQQSIQKRPLPQPDNVTVSRLQCRKTPPYQVNTNLLPSSVGVENPVSQPNSHNPPSLVATIPNTEVLSNSLEAIDTCLSMWKMKPFSDSGSSQNSLTKSNQTIVENHNQRDNSDSNNWSAETSVVGNDSLLISSVTSLKQEVGSSKVAEPQIAIVSPLVQANTKNHTESQSVLTSELIPAEVGSSSNNPTGQVITFGGIVGNVPPSTMHGGFKRHLLNELKAVKTVLDSISSHQNTPLLDSDSGDRSSVQKQSICKPPIEQLLQVSNEQSETSHEGSFQISGICSLVEGNSFYNSSVALMFNDLSLPPEAPSSLSNTDLKMAVYEQDRPEIGQVLCSSQAPYAESTVESFPENVGDGSFQPMDSSAECLDVMDIQAVDTDYVSTEQSEMEKPDLNVESTNLSDQLTELLSEFPLGIKNYMPDLVPEPLVSRVVENLPVVEKVCTLTEETPELLQIFKENSPSNDLPECKEELPVMENMCTLAEELPQLEPVFMMESPHEQVSLSFNIMPKIEKVESQSLPELREPSSLRESPIEVIQTPILNPEAVSLFTGVEDPEKLHNLSVETKTGTTGDYDSLSEDKGLESIQEKKSSKEMPEFCCLFKWLTYSYGKAPKCSCKPIEDTSERIFAKPTAGMPVLSPELNLDSSVPKSPEHNFREYLSPNNAKLKASGSSEVEFSAMKPIEPKRKTEECKPPVLDSIKDESLKQPHSSARRDAKPVLEANQCIQRKNPELNQSKEQNPKKLKHDHTTSRKAEKLIVKTDFLKHTKKERDSRERKSTQLPNSAGEQSVSSSSSQRPAIDPVRRYNSNKNIGEKRAPSPRRPSTEQSFQNGSSKPAMEKPKPTSSGLDRNVPFKPEDKTYDGQKSRAMPEHFQRRYSDNRDKGQESSMAPSKSQEKDYRRYSHSGKQKVRQNWNGHHVNHTKIKSPVKAKNGPSNRSSEQSMLAKNYNQFKREISKHKGYVSSGNKHMAPNHSAQGRTPSSSKTSDPTKPPKSKEKLYLGPCNSFNRPSPNSISLAKLEIRSSPENAKFTHAERRKSFEQTKPNKLLRTLDKNAGSPKMLQFKLCPELLQKSPSVQVRPEEPKTEKEHCRIEGIKSKKEAWYKDLPPKKRRIDSCDEQRDALYSAPAEPTSPPLSSESESTRQYQDSKAATFQAFQKMFLEKRSRSLDS